MSGDQLRRFKELEKENERLRRAVSDLTLDKQILVRIRSISVRSQYSSSIALTATPSFRCLSSCDRCTLLSSSISTVDEPSGHPSSAKVASQRPSIGPSNTVQPLTVTCSRLCHRPLALIPMNSARGGASWSTGTDRCALSVVQRYGPFADCSGR